MKWLKDEEYQALKTKAENHDSIVNSILAKNGSLKAEEITPEVILSAIENEGERADDTLSGRVTELEQTIESLNSTVTELTTERDNLNLRVEELGKLPGAVSVTAEKADTEITSVETDDLLAFATANSGDTIAIAEKMREAGYGVN